MEVANLEPEKDGGVDGGEEVADGEGEPYSVEAEEVGQDKEGGHEEDELAGEGEVYALACLPYALEEVACDHLETDDGEEGHIDTHTTDGHSGEGAVGGEEGEDGVGEDLAEDEAEGHHDGGIEDGLVEHLAHTVVQLRTVVIAGYGLHPLVEAHDNHGEEEEHTVHYAVGSDSEVAAILDHAAIDEQHDEAGAGIHQEW